MANLVPAFKQSIFNESLVDEMANIAEIGIDSILSEGLLRELPIFNLLLGASRTIKNIQERNLLKNTAIFINEVNSHKIDEKKLQKYKEKLGNEKFAERELGRVLILLNQYVDNIKCRILGRLFIEYVNQELTWEKFCELSDTVNRFFLDDIPFLLEISNSPESHIEYHIYSIPYNIRRLESIGLVEVYGEYDSFGGRLLQSEKMYVELTPNGKIFMSFISNLEDGSTN